MIILDDAAVLSRGTTLSELDFGLCSILDNSSADAFMSEIRIGGGVSLTGQV